MEIVVVLVDTLTHSLRKHFFKPDSLHEEILKERVWCWVPVHNTFVFDVELFSCDRNKSESIDIVLSVFEITLRLIVLRLAEIISVLS